MSVINLFTYNNQNISTMISLEIVSDKSLISNKQLPSNGYNNTMNYKSGDDNVYMNYYNIEKLHAISELDDNWNDNGAKKIPTTLIEKISRCLNSFLVQPDIFPTTTESLVLEYEKYNGDHLEFEIFDSGQMKIYSLTDEETEFFKTTAFDIEEINSRINEFYGK